MYLTVYWVTAIIMTVVAVAAFVAAGQAGKWFIAENDTGLAGLIVLIVGPGWPLALALALMAGAGFTVIAVAAGIGKGLFLLVTGIGRALAWTAKRLPQAKAAKRVA